ncbi:MAG: ATP-binding cassette domain-containing protein [Proteobacteria bacterium]|nr:ATP-binding cassette domain-containing protein [Pseudomonadota bacterium]
MALINFDDVYLDFGSRPILDGVNLSIERGQKWALIGRNGEGKSSLLKVINGDLPIDGGEVKRQSGLKVAKMQQSAATANADVSVRDFLLQSLGEVGQQLAAYEGTDDVDKMMSLQQQIDDAEGWSLLNQLDSVMTQLHLQGDADVGSLSGGVRRRLNLAAALVQSPDILLLDEPTNHLDIESIIWLQSLIKGLHCAVILVTHDRAFLRAVANGVLELDRGDLYAYDCDYDTFLKRQDLRLENEAKEWDRIDKKLSEEEVWVRQGIKARRTRSDSRLQDLYKLRDERKQRREKKGSAKADINVAEAGGKKVITAYKVDFAYQDKIILKDFSTKILRGDKVGIIGPNGVGKTTLVNILLGELEPDAGSVKLGTGIQVAYFDQLKQDINDNDTVQNNLQLGTDFVTINGKSRHVISYLQDFLFSPEKVRGPASVLSGGERSRLMLARLFARPANLLVMDEPTNDLDMETLDLLQELLLGFPGTVLLISHDRDFIDQVCSQTLVFENPVDGQYEINEYIGGYEDYLRQRKTPAAEADKSSAKDKTEKTTDKKPPAGQSSSTTNRLLFHEQKELKQLPAEIDSLEADIKQLSEQTCEPDFYQQDADAIKQVTTRLADLEQQLEIKFNRWDELEAKKSSS